MEGFHNRLWSWKLARYIDQQTGTKCRGAGDVSGVSYLFDSMRPDCAIIDLFESPSLLMTAEQLETTRQENYVGYLWAKSLLARCPEMAGRIVIYSHSLNRNLVEAGFRRVFPEDDVSALRLVGMDQGHLFEPIGKILEEIAKMPRLSR